MAIIPNIATVKKFLGASYINTTLPPMRKAESELRRVLGKALFDEVQASITAGTETELTALCQECVALYAYWLGLGDMMVQVGDKGLSVAVTDNNTQPYKWQFREKRDALAAKYMQGLEDLLLLLFETAPAAWVKPALYQGRSLLSGSQFCSLYPLRYPEAVFLQLLPIVQEVEKTYISKAIGKETMAALISTTGEATELLQRAVANFTIKEAAAKLSCQFSSDGFTVLMDPPDDPRSGRQNAPQQQITAAAFNAEKAGEGFITDLVKYLNQNASTTNYPDYFNSPFYKDPSIQTISPNACRTGVFGL